MTQYDHLLPAAKKLIDGLAAKPGVRITDRKMATDWVAQVLNGMIKRGELKVGEKK